MRFDEEFLKRVGLGAMPKAEKQAFLNYIQEELEVRIGERIAEGLSEQQLQEFDSLTDPEQITNWLHANRPDYGEIVKRTFAELEQEITANRENLLAPQPQAPQI